MRATLKFVDRMGVSTTIPLLGLDDSDPNILTKLSSLALTLRAWSNAAIPEYGASIATVQAITGQTAAVGDYDSSMQKGIARFSYVENNEKKNIALYIPAPAIGIFDIVDGVGYRMTKVDGEALRSALATATGKDLIFESGVAEYIDGKSSKPGDGAYILFQDYWDRLQYMGVPAVDDIAKLDALVTALFTTDDYTNAAPREIGIVTPQGRTRTDTPDQADNGYDSVNLRAVMKFVYIDSNDKKQRMTFTLPAAKEAVFNSVNAKKGIPVTQTAGQAIGTALSTVYGATNRLLKFDGGKLDYVNLEER